MIKIDAIGEACPIPVVRTRNAIRELDGAAGRAEIFVDNEIAVQNLTKMAEQKGYAVSSEQMEPQKYRVIMDIPGRREEGSPAGEESLPAPTPPAGGVIAVVSAAAMGTGSEELGKALLKSFFYALTCLDEPPKTLLFYNEGVLNTTAGSPHLEDLRALEARGAEILSCGTCLNYYGLTDQLEVGGITNMYDIVEKQMKASSVLRP